MNNNVGIVLVTFNRIDKLKKVLNCFDNQIFMPSYILLLDNNSNDGTKEFLNDWKNDNREYDKYIIFENNNLGGAGGFNKVLEKALNLDSDWIWIQDDDAYPNEDALLNINRFINNEDNINEYSALCGTVKNVNDDGIQYYHRRIIKPKDYFHIKEGKSVLENYNNIFEINAFSYVGTVINKKKLQEVGLPNKDFFIWYDDTEHSLRLSKIGKIVCLPNVIVHHEKYNKKERFSWKEYYGLRNQLYSWKIHFPKRYFVYAYYANMIKVIINLAFRKEVEKNKLFYCALKDAKNNKLGIHEKYKPGYIIDNY